MGGVAGASVLALASMAANAQQSDASRAVASDEPIEVVLVTARLRDERLQEVPASVSVLSADTLQNASIKNLTDVPMLAPNMRFTQGYRAGVLQIAMRGISTVQGGETPVAVVIDGVQLPAMDFINQDLLDAQSVEVLRGPQGALYGRGALAGALVINTRRPGETLDGRIRATYGNGGAYQILGNLSGPLVQNLLGAKLSYTYGDSDGFEPDGLTGRHLDSSRISAVRGELFFTPGESTELVLGGGYTDRREGASPLSRVPVARIDDFSVHPAHNRPSFDDQTLKNVFLKLNQGTPLGTLSSITQYAESRSYVTGEGDFRPVPVAGQINDITFEAFNQDLRLTSPEDQSVRWLVGAFFQERKGRVYADIFSDPVAGPSTTLQRFDNRDRSVAGALYTRLDVDVTDKLTISGALRYDRDEREDEEITTPGSAADHTFSEVQPQLTVSYEHTPDFMSYVSVGKGFRSGGFNRYSSTLLLNLPRRYPAETLWSYELGFKSQWLDRRLTLNADAFYMKMENAQFFRQRQLPSAQYITHIREARVLGGELEALLEPVSGLQLSLGVGINDSEIKDFDGSGLYEGNRLPNMYDPTFNFGVQYERTLAGNLSLLARADYQHFGDIFYNQTDVYRFGPTDYLNARLGLQNSGAWKVALWGKNLTDQRAPRNFSPQSCGVDCSSRINNLPRTYGVEIIVEF
jgi:iron complex outermembrane receptor protein